MQTVDLTKSLPLCRARLNAARVAHSAARKLVAEFPMGTRQDLEAAERAAYAAVEAARAAYETARGLDRVAPVHVCPHTHCCDLAVHARGTHYQHETQCPIHGNRTVGTCD